MLTRRNIAAGLGLSFAAPPVLAEAITPVSLTQIPPSQVPAAAPTEAPLLILDASLDQDARLTVPVTLNGQGPFQFVVDTGADRSVLTPGLAERLNLPQGPDVIVHGVSGSIQTTTARVANLRTGDARINDAVLPVLPYDRVGADGLLGVDILDGRNVVMDFRR
jgi:predicted aspartyl protease